MQNINVWETYDLEMQKSCNEFTDGYRHFISDVKTEREFVDEAVNAAIANGFVELSELIKAGTPLKKGDKVYSVHMNKSVVLFRIGDEPFENGINILGAHIDSPRMDIKQNPLYEADGLAMLDTHYYGGIKKYQFVALPLAIHGVVVKKSGETVILNVGEDPEDPVFFVSDLLIHLAQEQMEKNAAKVVEGEALDIIIGNKPVIIDAASKAGRDGVKAQAKDAVKNAILAILQGKLRL